MFLKEVPYKLNMCLSIFSQFLKFNAHIRNCIVNHLKESNTLLIDVLNSPVPLDYPCWCSPDWLRPTYALLLE